MQLMDMQAKMKNRRGLGEQGEELAVKYLKSHGFKIVARNVRYRAGEIDIVARNGLEIHFIEVRTRNAGPLVTAIDSITPLKRQHIRTAAEIFLSDKRYNFKEFHLSPCYFSVIGIEMKGHEPRIEFIKDAF